MQLTTHGAVDGFLCLLYSKPKQFAVRFQFLTTMIKDKCQLKIAFDIQRFSFLKEGLPQYTCTYTNAMNFVNSV